MSFREIQVPICFSLFSFFSQVKIIILFHHLKIDVVTFPISLYPPSFFFLFISAFLEFLFP